MDARMKLCNRCGFSLPLIQYYRHRIECRMKGRTCVHCHKPFDVLSSYHLHIATCLRRIVDKQRMKNQLRNFLPSKGLKPDVESDETKLLKSDIEEPVPLKGPNYCTLCSLCKQSFRSVHLFRLHLAREGLCRPKPYICRTCNREFMSSYHLLSHEKRKKPCVPKSAVASKGGLKVKFVRKKPIETDPLNTILNSESSNSVASEGEYAPIKSTDFYEHRTGYENKEHGLVGSMQQFAADKNILKNRSVCKGCSIAFASEEELQKHFQANPSCAVKNREVPEMTKYRNVKQNETKQTARKSTVATSSQSLPSAYSSATGITRNEVPTANNQKQGQGFPHQVAVGAKFSGDGSARKSSQDPLIVQAQRNGQNEMEMSCSICHMTFPDAETLQAHKKVHPAGAKPNYASKCPVCFQVFNNAFLLFGHQKKHQHWGKSAKCKTSGCKCPFCDKVFLYVRSRNAHLRGHDDVGSENIENFLKKTTCEVCSLAFVSENQKIQHRKVEHPDWTDALPKLFSNFDLRNQDSGKRNHDQKKVIDHKQGTVPPKKNKVLVKVTPSLKAKLKAHPNTCPICFKQYSTTFVRNRHFRMHILDKSFECKWCPLKFHRSEPLNSHMQKEHNDRLGFECLVCGLRYLTKFRVLQHISKSHNSQAPQKLVKECQIPPELSGMKKTPLVFKNESYENGGTFDFEDKSDYGKSKNSQDFYCEVCETSFLKLCGLQRHRQSKNHKDILAAKDPQAASEIRKEESPSPIPAQLPRAEQQDVSESVTEFNCSVCLKLFTSVIEFVPHRLSHFHHAGLSEITETNPYTCEICTVSVDHHQKVQWHLLHHLQSAKAKKANLPQWKFSFTPRNFEICPIKITNVRMQKSPISVQVAKKTVTYNKPEKPIPKDLVLSGVHRNVFTCDACNVVFTTKHHYSAHVRRYCPVRKAAVGTDGQMEMEKSPNNLRTKWRLHENSPKLLCHYCTLEFGTVDELGWHEKSCRKVNGPVNGSLEDDGDEFYYCKVCQCLFPFEHSYKEHRKLFCFEDESLEKLHSDYEDEVLDRLKSAIELEAAVASCVRCSMIFLSVQKLCEHMACHIMKPKQFSIPAGEGRTFSEENSDVKAKHPEEQKFHTFSKASENCGKVSFNIVDILSDSNASKKSDNMGSVNKVTEIGRLPKSVEPIRKEEIGVSEQSDSVADLRTDFAELLYILVDDCELMEQLGWGKRPIDLVLDDVLKHMGHNPVTVEQVNRDLDRLRQNIQILLETCISDDIITNASINRKPIDVVVTEVLQMCKAQSNLPALPMEM